MLWFWIVKYGFIVRNNHEQQSFVVLLKCCALNFSSIHCLSLSLFPSLSVVFPSIFSLRIYTVHCCRQDKSITEYDISWWTIDEIISNPKWLVLIDSNNVKRKRSKLSVRFSKNWISVVLLLLFSVSLCLFFSLTSETEISEEYLCICMNIDVWMLNTITQSQ